MAPGSPSALPPHSINAPPQGGPANETPQAIMTRDAALAATTRVPLDSKALFGSINLTGARIDDVSLKAYRETPNPKSANIVLLSPSSAPTPYYAEMGYVSATAGLPLPGATTVWKSDGGKLTSETPVDLDRRQWSRPDPSIVRIAIDDHYMFTVTDTIENRPARPLRSIPIRSSRATASRKRRAIQSCMKAWSASSAIPACRSRPTIRSLKSERDPDSVRHGRLARLHRQILGDGRRP